eukprot:473657-Amphidinium_carterae.1
MSLLMMWNTLPKGRFFLLETLTPLKDDQGRLPRDLSLRPKPCGFLLHLWLPQPVTWLSQASCQLSLGFVSRVKKT